MRVGGCGKVAQQNTRANVCTALKQRVSSVCLQALSFSVTVNTTPTSLKHRICNVHKSGFCSVCHACSQIWDFPNDKQPSVFSFEELVRSEMVFFFFCRSLI